MYRTPTREVASVATDGPGCGDEFMLGGLSDLDPEVAQALKDEARRENETINLIASENYASCAVLEAQGSIMTNKYAEGYPDKRYYGGCQYVDVVEKLAIKRANQCPATFRVTGQCGCLYGGARHR